jgi:hypothetical protein
MTDLDGYESYYAQRLWAMLPAVYRTEDTSPDGAAGPLRDLLNRIGAQVAVVRRSLDQLWADQAIETCADWVIPYLGDLLGTNLVNGLDPDGQRLDVAKTIHYRRRKGTLAVLEELAIDVSRDVTDWDVHVVEGFRRLARTRHGLDPVVGPAAFPGASPGVAAQVLGHEGLIGPLTGTPAGGYADLRSVHGAALSNTPFDESFHTADFRRGQGATGHFGIPKLLVFIWRLTSLPVTGGTPVAVDGCDGQYTFDPTGRRIPLFLPPPPPEPNDFADTWTPAAEWQVPGPITASLQLALGNLSGSTAPPGSPYPSPPPGISPPAAFGYSVQGGTLAQAWPEVGVFSVADPPSSPPGPVAVHYQYGFPGLVGAGPYNRALIGDPPVQGADPSATASGGGTRLAAALGEIGTQGTVTVTDSLTYTKLAPVGSSADPLQAVLVRTAAATPPARPVLRPGPRDGPWVFTGSGEATLTLDGLLISGCDVILRGSFDTVTITACTLDPGTAARPAPASPPGGGPLDRSVDGRPLAPATLWIEADQTSPPGTSAIAHLKIDHCVTGPIRTRFGGSVEDLTITDSIVQGIATTTGPDYTAADVYDPALLAVALRSDSLLAQQLWIDLPPTARAALISYASPGAVPQAVIDGLNDLVGGADLYAPDLFAAVTLSPDVEAAAASPQSPAGAGLAALNRGLLDEAFPVALGTAAIAVANATVTLQRVTVLGRMAVHRLQASDSVLDDFAVVDDTQDGCVRFSAYSTGSRLPQQYQSAAITAGAPVFTSTSFGDPGYGQLLDCADQAVTAVTAGATLSAGASTGSEVGAFSASLAPIKEQGILTKYAEYMPLGLTPVIVHVT